MKEEKNNINEIEITPEEISNIDPLTISKIILSDGTILKVQKNSSTMKENSKNLNNNNDFGGLFNLKSNQNTNSYKKSKHSYSYVEWDFPKSKYKDYTHQRNIENKLMESKTEQNDNNNMNDNSRDSALNKNRKSKNYSYFESKHISKKNNSKTPKEQRSTSENLKNENNNNSRKIDNKDNNIENINKGNKNEENENKVENKEDIKNKNDNIDNKDKNEDKEEQKNKKVIKENLTFNEKIRMIKYGLLDYDYNSSGLKNEENNIQKINKIRPLNIIIDKTKNKNEEDINTQFNKLLNKYNENKNSKKKLNDTNNNNSNSKIAYKSFGKDSNLNGDIIRLSNYIHKNKFHSNYNNLSKNENFKGNNSRDLNERISQLRKKTLNNNLMNFFPSNTTYYQKKKFYVLPLNYK